MHTEDTLATLLAELLGDKPDRFGYGAAHRAMDDSWRARAHAALAAHKAAALRDAERRFEAALSDLCAMGYEPGICTLPDHNH